MGSPNKNHNVTQTTGDPQIPKNPKDKSIQYSTTLLKSTYDIRPNDSEDCLRKELEKELMNMNQNHRNKPNKKTTFAKLSPSNVLMRLRKEMKDQITQDEITLIRSEEKTNLFKDQCNACDLTCCERKVGGVCSPKCRALSVGTAEYRSEKYERCNTMLIGGCRVRVKKNSRTSEYK